MTPSEMETSRRMVVPSHMSLVTMMKKNWK